jgi:hypothetical protein
VSPYPSPARGRPRCHHTNPAFNNEHDGGDNKRAFAYAVERRIGGSNSGPTPPLPSHTPYPTYVHSLLLHPHTRPPRGQPLQHEPTRSRDRVAKRATPRAHIQRHARTRTSQ